MKPKVLFLNVEFPLPTDHGGKLAVLGFIEALYPISALTVLTFGEGDFEPQVAQLKKNLPELGGVHVVQHKIHMRRDLRALLGVSLQMATKNLPYFAAKFLSPTFKQTLDDLLTKNHYDHIVVCHDTRLGAYLPLLRNRAPHASIKSIVIDIEANVIADFIKRQTSNLLKMLARYERVRCMRFESQVRDSVDHSFCLSMSDMDQIQAENTQRSVSYLPTAIKPPRSVFHTSDDSDVRAPGPAAITSVLMVSNFSWQPNAEAAEWMLDEVAPRLWALSHRVEIRLVGQGSIEIAARRNNLLVKGLGFVDDIQQIYAQTSAVAIPVLSTSGVRVKLLDAMASGLPIVSTEIAAKAIGAIHSVHLLASDDPQRFAENIIELTTNQHLSRNLRTNALSFIRMKHSVTRIQKEFETNFTTQRVRTSHKNTLE